MIVTTANRGDIPELVHLLSWLFSQETEYSPNAHVQERGLLQIIERPDAGQILVARESGTIVGMVDFYILFQRRLAGRFAFWKTWSCDLKPEAEMSAVPC